MFETWFFAVRRLMLRVLGDLAVLHPAGDQPQHVELARRELLERPSFGPVWVGCDRADPAEHDLGRARRQPGRALRRRAHGRGHVRRSPCPSPGTRRRRPPSLPRRRRLGDDGERDDPRSPERVASRISRVASVTPRRRASVGPSAPRPGAARRPAGRPARPPDACATTSMSGCGASSDARPVRNRSWSSTIRTRGSSGRIVLVHRSANCRRPLIVATAQSTGTPDTVPPV